MFPADNIWNTKIDTLPVDANSAAYISSIGSSTAFHADFGSGTWNGGPIGIPYNLVNSSQSTSTVSFTYSSESDAGPYPIPSNPNIEGGSNSTGDRHILIINTTTCILYELYSAYPPSGSSGWTAGSGAIFDLASNALRTDTWTSADAAGLPILPGLVRYDEVQAGAINHAIRFTAQNTRRAYVWPARHYASSLTATQYPPMGQRFRLKSSFDASTMSAAGQVIATAMKNYGIILADNGSNWFVSGVPDAGWDDTALSSDFSKLHGSDFEAVDVSSLMLNSDSGQTAPLTPALTLAGLALLAMGITVLIARRRKTV